LEPFNPLFPKGNYFGVLATAGPGPINFIDVHPRAETTLPQGVTVSVDWIFQWRETLRDGVYSVPGFLIIPAEEQRAFRWKTVRARKFAGRRTNIYGFKPTTGFFLQANFVKESQPGRNLNYWALWAGYKF